MSPRSIDSDQPYFASVSSSMRATVAGSSTTTAVYGRTAPSRKTWIAGVARRRGSHDALSALVRNQAEPASSTTQRRVSCSLAASRVCSTTTSTRSAIAT
jgi:hypothetical protein